MLRTDDRVNLRKLFDELAASAEGARPSEIEDRLRAACRARRVQRRWRLGAGVAACLVMAGGWGWHFAQRPALAMANPKYSGFVALPYAQSDVPLEQAVVIRVDLQPANLEAFGLPAALLPGRNRIQADLLIGQDGIARAVRLAQ